MLKRTIVIPLCVFICVVVALICTSINGYLINQLAPIDKFPAVYRFLDGRSDPEKAGLMGITIVILGVIAAGLTWMGAKLPKWMGTKDQSIGSLESGRRMLLIKQQTNEVNDRLKLALERSTMIPLALGDASKAVGRAIPMEGLNPVARVAQAQGFLAHLVQAKKKLTFWKGTEVELPQHTKMIDVFRWEDVSGRLLILGHPGAGKTTTLLELARELLVEAKEKGTKEDETKRIPHVFEMSRWEKGLDLVEYLAIELKREHTLDLAIGRGMAASGELLPLLDGLDELRDPRAISAAMGAINTYLKEGAKRDAVVCCRVLDYELASEQLRELNGAIELQPLSEIAIQDYLKAVKKEKLWALVEQNPGLVRSNDPNILPLLKTPLFLSVFAAVSPTVAVKSESDLWDAYIVKQLGIPSEKLSGKGYKRYLGTEEPTQKQTKNYLIFLAQQLQRTTEVMLIEEMQPTWLRSEPKVLGRLIQQWQYGLEFLHVFGRSVQQLQYSLISGLISGLIWGVIIGPAGGLIVGLPGGLIQGLIWGIMMGSIIGLIFSLMEILTAGGLDAIEPIEKLRFSMSLEARREIFKWFIPSLRFGLIVGLIIGLIVGLITGLIVGLRWGLKWGLILGLIIWNISLSHKLITELKIRTEPNQGIKSSIKDMVILMSMSSFLVGSMYLLQSSTVPSDVKHILLLFGNLNILLIVPTIVLTGGKALIQHLSLRITLYLSHQKPNDSQTRCIPWNYARFLSYAADRKLLQQTGGAYRFIHRSLLEHFAGMGN